MLGNGICQTSSRQRHCSFRTSQKALFPLTALVSEGHEHNYVRGLIDAALEYTARRRQHAGLRVAANDDIFS